MAHVHQALFAELHVAPKRGLRAQIEPQRVSGVPIDDDDDDGMVVEGEQRRWEGYMFTAVAENKKKKEKKKTQAMPSILALQAQILSLIHLYIFNPFFNKASLLVEHVMGVNHVAERLAHFAPVACVDEAVAKHGFGDR